jgi:hypothetical protein
MAKDIIFEELGREEKILLLRAFDYDVDEKDYILNENGSRIRSKECPNEFLTLKNAALTPGSLEVIDSSPTSISKFLREKIEVNGTD